MFQHRAALKDMGDEFVIGVTDLVSGEKDPRNLMIIFSVLKAVMVEWDISGRAEVRILAFRSPNRGLTRDSQCLIPFSVTSQSPSDRRQMILMGLPLKTSNGV